MKERVKEKLEELFCWGIVGAMFLWPHGAVFVSPFRKIRKIKEIIALRGLTSEQQAILKKLKNLSFVSLGQMPSDNEDFIRARMISPAFACEILYLQKEHGKQREKKIEELIETCHKMNISKWRIKAVL